jgi:hypothetical protein
MDDGNQESGICDLGQLTAKIGSLVVKSVCLYLCRDEDCIANFNSSI